ncbi:MAG: NAD(P)H-dependent oxidoreductase [Anaerolineae bacterium]|nr:NAD(P)H-dependent oxidoreductase [Anaerolineae bacterium]
MAPIRILAIPGSLREGSVIKQLLRSLQLLAPSDVEITLFDLKDIPLYNQDVEDSVGFPPAVQAFRDAIESADGLIIATPEYNGAESGVVKNAIDWASRKGLMAQRPVTPITGSPGALGATKAQESLRSVLNHLGMYAMPRPALAIPKLPSKLDGDTIADETTARFVRQWLATFRDWILLFAQ